MHSRCIGSRTTSNYTLSLHDALPIWFRLGRSPRVIRVGGRRCVHPRAGGLGAREVTVYGMQGRSEEHTSELQSRSELVCRLLLAKKNIYIRPSQHHLPVATLSDSNYN